MAKYDRLRAVVFAKIYPIYVSNAEKKRRSKANVDEIIFWLMGYDEAGLQEELDQKSTAEQFVLNAPKLNPNRSLIKGVVCGDRVEEVEDPLMREIRYLDKLIHELVQGKTMEKILRQV